MKLPIDKIPVDKIPIVPMGKWAYVIKKVVDTVKSLFGSFKNLAQKAGKTDSKDSLEKVEHIAEIFADFREQVHSKTVEMERAMTEEVDYYLEELRNILSMNHEKVEKYGIRVKWIERQMDRVSSEIKGSIDNEVSKKVSLDNAACKEIMTMIPGEKKETAMNDFFEEAAKLALNKCCEDLHSSLDEIYEDVEIEIIGAVESIQNQIEQLQAGFDSIDEENYEETAKKQMVDAYCLTDTCDLVLDLL